jgi:hypothetical protein
MGDLLLGKFIIEKFLAERPQVHCFLINLGLVPFTAAANQKIARSYRRASQDWLFWLAEERAYSLIHNNPLCLRAITPREIQRC